jgi:hypothetical protein
MAGAGQMWEGRGAMKPVGRECPECNNMDGQIGFFGRRGQCRGMERVLLRVWASCRNVVELF